MKVEKKIWITKYWWSRGIYQVDARIDENTCYAVEKVPSGGQFTNYFYDHDWEDSEEEAKRVVIERAKKKLKSLNKRKKKIENIIQSLS